MMPINPLNDNLRGCAYMAFAMFCFVVNDAIIRTVGDELPIGQILFLRGGILVILIALTAWFMGLLGHWRQLFLPPVLIRAGVEFIGAMAFLSALMQIPFANVSAILQCLPLAVTLGAALFFNERVGIWLWSAIVLGFSGVLIIIRPGLEGFSPAALWLLVTVVCAAARDLIARALPVSVPSMVATFSTAAVITAGGAGMTLLNDNWASVNAGAWVSLCSSAVFLFGAYHFIVLAMRVGDVGFVAPFRYTSLLWAVVLGWFAFSEWPDLLTTLGSLLIVCMGLLTIYRETRLRRGANKVANSGARTTEAG